MQPFEKKFGVKVIHDATGTSSQDYAKIRASRGAPGFDVAAALSPPEVILGAKEGLLEKITEKEVPNLKFTWEKARAALPPTGAMHTLQFDSLLYNKDKIERPQSWADYWQPEKRYGAKIKGHVINYNPANLLSVYALIHAAELGGGSAANMEPAWALLKAQKPYVGVVVTASAEAVPAFRERRSLDVAVLERARGLLHQPRPSVRDDGAEGRRDREHRLGVGAGRREEQEAGLRVHQLLARARDAARMEHRVFLQPGTRRHRRLAEGLRGIADRHARSSSNRSSCPTSRRSAPTARIGRCSGRRSWLRADEKRVRRDRRLTQAAALHLFHRRMSQAGASGRPVGARAATARNDERCARRCVLDERGRRARCGEPRRVPEHWLLIVVPATILLLFFVLPNALLLSASFLKSEAQQLTSEPTLENYTFLLTRPLYLEVLLRTFVVGVCVGAIDVVLGFPLAYFLVRTKSRWKGLLIALSLAPLLASVIVRTYGWYIILNRFGVVNDVAARARA